MSLALKVAETLLEVLSDPVSVLLIREGKIYEGSEVAFRIPDIVSMLVFLEMNTAYFPSHFDQNPDGVSQLDFAFVSRGRLFDRVEYFGCEDVSPRNGQSAWSILSRRLLDDIVDLEIRPAPAYG